MMAGVTTSMQPVEVDIMAARLSFAERARVEALRAAGVAVATVAQRLGRDPSTIHRELTRDRGGDGYDAAVAQRLADRRALRPKTPKLAADRVLAAMVRERQSMRWSPQAISADLRCAGHTVRAETIYAACYDRQGSRGLPQDAWRLLPRRCRERKPRSRAARKPDVLGDFKPVSRRPSIVQQRSEPGHWEGDLIIGAGNRSAAVTLVERVSRQSLTAALPNGYTAERAAAAVTAALSRQPRHLVKTLTWDQGREMARWAHIEQALGIDIYFCDPRSPWQRASNEQTNGLLRRWLPKSTDLDINPARLAVIEDNLNHMPRKLHSWQSAHSIYTALTCNHH